MSEKTKSTTVITDTRNVTVVTENGELKLELRKPADREDGKNNIIYISIFGEVVGEKHQLANTRMMLDAVQGISLMPEQYKDEESPTGYTTSARYPGYLKGGKVRKAIEKAVADELGAVITFSNPMLGTMPEDGAEENS